MGERLLCKHQVIGSIPIGSTIAEPLGGTLHACRLAVREISRDEDILFVQAFGPDEYRGARRLTFDIVNGF